MPLLTENSPPNKRRLPVWLLILAMVVLLPPLTGAGVLLRAHLHGNVVLGESMLVAGTLHDVGEEGNAPQGINVRSSSWVVDGQPGGAAHYSYFRHGKWNYAIGWFDGGAALARRGMFLRR